MQKDKIEKIAKKILFLTAQKKNLNSIKMTKSDAVEMARYLNAKRPQFFWAVFKETETKFYLIYGKKL